MPNKLLIKHQLKFKLLFLVYLITPLHWNFFDDQCVFTLVSRKSGGMKGTLPEYGFTQTYLGPFYKPVMNLFGLDWNEPKDLDAMISIHWITIFIAWWYIICFKLNNTKILYKCNKK